MEEQWKPVPGWEDAYEISNFGRLRGVSRLVYGGKNSYRNEPGKILKPIIRNTGYPAYNLYRNAKKHTLSTHRLVALAFIPNPEGKPFVNHIDGTRNNSHVTNLEWCTQKENVRHAWDTGASKALFGEKCPASKLKEEQVREIYAAAITRKVLQKDIGAHYGVHAVNVGNILRGRIWKHLKLKEQYNQYGN